MRRPRTRKTAAGVELFSFLAVLMCTMGTLILLLLIIARQARLEAAQSAAARPDASTELESLRGRISEQEGLRAAADSLVARRQSELVELESQLRGLRQRLAELDASTVDDQSPSVRDSLEAELTRLRDRIAEAETRLNDARESASQGRSYQIVPYEGPHGTRRRPIYIECQADGIVLQPEGVVLFESDFPDPLGPRNALAAAVREAARYFTRQDPLDEPYPLLLVRPDGIGTYYTARAALKNMDADFGYELIEQEWSVEYQPPDTELAEAERLAVAEARSRQRLLSAAASRGGNGRGGGRRSQRPEFRVAEGGGVVRADGQPLGNDTHAAEDGRTFGNGATRHESGDDSLVASTAPARGAADARPATDDRPPAEPELHPGEYREAVGESPSPAAASPPDSLANKRGEQDWALPDATRGSIPVTRPIRIHCDRQRLTILAERGGQQAGKNVPLTGQTEDSVEALVSAVWQHMEGWGIAGKGMYWRPVLQMEVTAEGEERYQDLAGLLEGSGLVVRRKLVAARSPVTDSQRE